MKMIAGRRAKPRLVPLDVGWHTEKLAALDIETTGVDPLTDRIVAFAGLADDHGDVVGIVNPGVPIPLASREVHGMSASDVAGAPPPPIGLEPLVAWLNKVIETRTGLVVYNAAFDLTMLRAEVERHGLPAPQWEDLLVIDPWVIDWAIDPDRPEPRTLANVARRYGVTLAKAHDARLDAIASREIARVLGQHSKVGMTLSMVMAQQRYWVAARTHEMNLAAYRRGRTLERLDNWPWITVS